MTGHWCDGERFVGQTGLAGQDERQVVEGTQVLAQAIVVVPKRFSDKSVRSAHAVFTRAVVVGPPVEFRRRRGQRRPGSSAAAVA